MSGSTVQSPSSCGDGTSPPNGPAFGSSPASSALRPLAWGPQPVPGARLAAAGRTERAELVPCGRAPMYHARSAVWRPGPGTRSRWWPPALEVSSPRAFPDAETAMGRCMWARLRT
eukprot:9471977-Pyramimonas_sp.AAC.1